MANKRSNQNFITGDQDECQDVSQDNVFQNRLFFRSILRTRAEMLEFPYAGDNS